MCDKTCIDCSPKLNLQSSQYTTFMECPRKWYYQYMLWRDVPPTYAMQKGTLFHAMQEWHHKDGVAVEDLAAYTVANHPDLVQYLADIFPAFLAYEEHYEGNDYEFHIIDGKPAIETEIKIELTPDINYWMKFDSIRERNGKLYLFDWKVTGAYVNEYYFRGFELANQTFAYSWAARELFGKQMMGFYIDAVGIPKSKKIQFGRQFFPVVSMIEEFIAELIRTAEWINAHKHDENYFEHRWTGCINKYRRRCQFADVCLASPSRRKELLMSEMFIDNTPIYDFSGEGEK